MLLLLLLLLLLMTRNQGPNAVARFRLCGSAVVNDGVVPSGSGA